MRHLVLAAILIVAWMLRSPGLLWDEGTLQNPDERFLISTVAGLELPPDFPSYLDGSRSLLNPRNHGIAHFAYGTLPLTFLKIAAQLEKPATAAEWASLARTLSAYADLGTLVCIYLLGLAFSYRTAWMAAALWAVTVIAIQHAHFFVVDTFAAFFATAALAFAAWAYKKQHNLLLLAAGAMSGLALSCKISMLPLVLLIAALPVVQGVFTRSWRAPLGAASMVLLGALIAWRVGSPDVFDGMGLATNWLADMRKSMQLASGEVEFPPGIQWADRTPWLFPLKNLALWAIGPALFLSVLAGFSVAAVEVVKNTRKSFTSRTFLSPGLVLLVVWIAGMMFYLGGAFVTTLRYFLPVLPACVVLAAWSLSRCSRLWSGAVLLATAAWALAFIRIYDSPHPRVAAERWMIQNISPGSMLGTESWDENLLRSAEAKARFTLREMHWAGKESPEKQAQALDWLDQVDYIVLASDRARLTLPRLPTRFPLAARYYRALDDGSIGFTKVAEFDRRPQLFDWRWPTPEKAEEAFSVYDHPVVRIYKKRPDFAVSPVASMFRDIDWSRVVDIPSPAYRQVPTGLMLPKEQWELQKAGKSWREIFFAHHRAPWKLTLAWCALLFLAGLLFWPFLFLMAQHWPDGGWAFARCGGIVFGGWLWWFAGSYATTHVALWLSCIVFSSVSLYLWFTRWHAMKTWLLQHPTTILDIEIVFWAVFAAGLFLRMWNPDMWHPHFGGEKPMDLTYLTAVAKSEMFPPYNPWFSGGYINYYYFGFVPVAFLIRLCGAAPEVAYQLALATWPAFCASAVYGIARSMGVTRALSWLAVPLLLLAGSWNQLKLVLTGSTQASDWFWKASRGFAHAPNEAPPITEFPFFTFLYGDLHAHLLAMPMVLFTIALAIHIARTGSVAAMSVGGMVIGILLASNTWDVPAAIFLLVAGAIFYWQPWKNVTRAGMLLLGVGGCYLAFRFAFHPFTKWSASGYGGASFWHGSRTPALDCILHYGTFATILCGVVLLRRDDVVGRKWLWGVLAAASVFAAIIGLGASAVILPAMVVAAAGVVQGREFIVRIGSALVALALGLMLIPEWLTLDGDVGRMNTVFKFHHQSWLLLGIGAAALLSHMWSTHRRTAIGLAVISILPGLVYPITSTGPRLAQRFNDPPPPTLDGTAFMDTAHLRQNHRTLKLEHDWRVIRWLRNNTTGTPVIAEIPTPRGRYDWNSRISTFTGFPIPAGWASHLHQQRRLLSRDMVLERIRDTKLLYDSTDPLEKRRIMQRYGIEYVVVTHVERAYATPAGLAALDTTPGLKRVWEKSAARIYQFTAVPE